MYKRAAIAGVGKVTWFVHGGPAAQKNAGLTRTKGQQARRHAVTCFRFVPMVIFQEINAVFRLKTGRGKFLWVHLPVRDVPD